MAMEKPPQGWLLLKIQQRDLPFLGDLARGSRVLSMSIGKNSLCIKNLMLRGTL